MAARESNGSALGRAPLDELDASGPGGGPLLTADELAARWQVPRSWVYAASRSGRIPVIRLGHYYRYRLDAIAHWETAQQSTEPHLA
jgi:excisionase family DNA binding protein